MIHRAHANDDAVLEKIGKMYKLRSGPNNPITTVQGIDKIKARIKGLLNEIEKIPVSDFKTEEEFRLFKKIQSILQEISN